MERIHCVNLWSNLNNFYVDSFKFDQTTLGQYKVFCPVLKERARQKRGGGAERGNWIKQKITKYIQVIKVTIASAFSNM